MSLWRQTVTVYSRRGEEILRTVYTGCCYQWRTEHSTDEWGTRQDTTFLLTVPGAVPLAPGDRVYEGEGPQIGLADWSWFLPANVPGMGQIDYVRPCYWNDRVCHTEAGRK